MNQGMTYLKPSVKGPSVTERLAMRVLFSCLSRIHHGNLTIKLPDGSVRRFGIEAAHPAADLIVHIYRFFTKVVFGGEIGFGEAYSDGYWDSSDLVMLITLLIENNDVINDATHSANFLTRAVQYLLHRLRDNTRSRARENIRAHYDLGNDFFSSFLDPTMMYSCAIFSTEHDSLEDAQKNKIGSIIKKAEIKEGDHVLEIGCGWGGFAIEAVRQTGCRMHCITLSQEQLELARARIQEQGLSDRINLQLCDYREVNGTFDKIVSIEMLEAVGHKHFPSYFQTLNRCLKPDGVAVIQVITTPDQHYDEYCRRADWMQKYIFPGGHLPSLGALVEAMKKYSSLCVEHVENIGKHYAATLRAWRERFESAWPTIERAGYREHFRRIWRYYLSICEAGFQSRIINDLQIVFRRQGPLTIARGIA